MCSIDDLVEEFQIGNMLPTVPLNSESMYIDELSRSELPDDVFGIPEERKYPMHDKKHTISAIKLFNHVEKKYEKQLANKIISNMERFNIDFSIIGEKNRLKNYIDIENNTVKERMNDDMDCVEDLMYEFFGESSNGGDKRIPDLIEPVVHQIESKGYKVKYASPGHANTRFDNDRNKDGVINSKIVTTGRIIFERDYKFKSTPQGWEWKVLENGSKALYVKPYTYNEKIGSPEEAFEKWQTFYMDSIKDWAVKLPQIGTKDDSAPDENFGK